MPDKDGYFRVLLYNGSVAGRKPKRVNRLIALAYHENPDNLPLVNHKDENKQNNRPENLEWCDESYNVNYGTSIARVVDKNSIPIYAFNGSEIRYFSSTAEASRILKIPNGDITTIVTHGSENYKRMSSSKGWTFSRTKDFPNTKFKRGYVWIANYGGVIHIYPNRATLERDEHVFHQTFAKYINTGIKIPNKDFSIERRPKQHVTKVA